MKQKKQHGYTIFISILIVGAVAAAIVFSSVLMGTGMLLDSLNIKKVMDAENYRDACIERLLEDIASDNIVFSDELQLENGSCSYTIAEQEDNQYVVIVNSSAGDAVRTAELLIDASDPVVVVVGWKEETPTDPDPEDPVDPDPEEPTVCSNQQSFFVVNNSSASFNATGDTIEGVRVNSSTNDCEITLTSISVSWNNPAGRRLEQININGSSVWSGNLGQGGVADITDTTLKMSDGVAEINYSFSNTITGRNFNFTYTFEDGTQRVLNGVTFD